MTPFQTMTATQLLQDIASRLAAGDMPALEQLVFAHRDTPVAQEVLAAPSFAQVAATARQTYRNYEVADELRLRMRLLAEGERTYAASELVERTHRYVPLEVTAAGVGRTSTYCHVGCGPLPETLLAVAETARPHVAMGIDADGHALAQSIEFARAVAPARCLRFMHAAGEAVSYERFTHIHMAVLVRPEDTVVRRICRTASVRWPVTLLLRTAVGLSSLLYQPLGDETLALLARNGFTHRTTVRGHALMRTAIYRREP